MVHTVLLKPKFEGFCLGRGQNPLFGQSLHHFISIFFKASLSLIDYVWVHCTTYLSKVSETGEGVIFGYMKMKKRWINWTQQHICNDNSENFHNVKMLFFRFSTELCVPR